MSGKEVFFQSDEVIVSKTDLKGRIAYVNDVFVNISGFKESELLGQPHSVIRHESMPRCIFQLLWERVSQGKEIFAYVVNSCKNGDYYWVFAHVTPSFDSKGNVTGYHSNRRVPTASVIQEKVKPLYENLLEIEKNSADRKLGQAKSYDALLEIIANSSACGDLKECLDANACYDEFVFSLNPKRAN